MQLRRKLGLAVGSLLAGTHASASDWSYDASLMSYYEQDGQQQDRVSIIEPVVSLTKHNADDDFFSFEVIYDSLSGASPNGATSSSRLQAFNGYQVLPGYTPLDTRFKDTRTSMNVSWMTPYDRLSRYQAGVSYSAETDYSSMGVNYSYLKDINNKRTTLSMGAAFSYDAVNPHGGFHNSFSSIFLPTTQTLTSASGGSGEGLFPGKKKKTLDVLLGMTHILNPITLLNINYGLSQSNGYQTDPYKIISVLDAQGFAVDYVWEGRPDSRFKQTLKGSLITAIGQDALHLDYRHYWDDWGIGADTYDVSYHLKLGEHFYMVPHYRLSQQSRADFFVAGLDQSQPLPQYASADYRLGDMTTTTYGGMIAYRLSPSFTLTLNADRIQQRISSAGVELAQNNIFPDINMWAFTIGIRGEW